MECTNLSLATPAIGLDLAEKPPRHLCTDGKNSIILREKLRAQGLPIGQNVSKDLPYVLPNTLSSSDHYAS